MSKVLTLTPEQREALSYLDVDKLADDLSMLPKNHIPEIIQILYDGIPVFDWATKDPFPETTISADYKPEVIELAFDGKPVFLTVDKVVILNRCENLQNFSISSFT
jgi:hypothetical protein